MKSIQLGTSTLQCSRLAYGCWRLAGTWDPTQVTDQREATGRRAVIAAYEAGYTLFDHADIYCDGMAEILFGQTLREVTGMRQRILIGSKCGIRKAGEPQPGSPYRYDFSAEHIVRSCERSLTRLGVDNLDLYQLHRPDYLCHPQEIAAAFDRLKKAGKVREFGVSNFRPSQVAALQKACPMPLIVNQVEISLVKLDCLHDGTLDQCLLHQMTPLAWSPLAGGRLGSHVPIELHTPDHAKRLKLRETIEHVARERGANPSVIAFAWLLKHPSGIVPIVGSTKPERIVEAVKAAELELTREEWYRLLESALGERLP
ncbi:MAG: aldo/keto reductase [Verrucomicrobia bacterium]|nr:aldo/keto reductase [Verrucomicrobiota bacterium]